MAKFEELQRVKHCATGIVYRILRAPDHRKLESSAESFYEYESVTSGDVWVRCQSEMEDGRFEEI